MNRQATSAHELEPRDIRGLLSLTVGLALGAVVLNGFAGPPSLPTSLPSWDLLIQTLRGASVPYEAFAYILTTAAWGVWLWITGSLLLRLLVVIAELPAA